jgi:hypothetical protein
VSFSSLSTGDPMVGLKHDLKVLKEWIEIEEEAGIQS